MEVKILDYVQKLFYKKILVNQERLLVEDMDEVRYMLYFHLYDYKC